MSKFRNSLLLLSFITMVAILGTACKSGKKSGSADVLGKVPENATAVFVLDMGQLMSKADFESIKQTEGYKDFVANAVKTAKDPEFAKAILENPEEMGISMKGQYAVFVEMASMDKVAVSFLLPIADNAKFDEALKKAAKEEDSPFKEIKEKNGFKYVTDKSNDGDNNIGFGWDGKLVCLTVVAEDVDALSKLEAVFATKADASILKNAQFKKHLNAGHDALLWASSDPLMTAVLADKQAAAQLKSSLFFAQISEDDLKGNTMVVYYDFKNGSMEVGANYDINAKLKSEFGIALKNKVGTDFSKLFPLKDLMNISIVGLDTKGILEILKKRNVDKMADAQLAALGMSTEEALMSLKGDMAFATYLNSAATSEADMQQMVLAIEFEKIDFLDKLIGLAKMMGTKVDRKGNRLTIKGPGTDIHGFISGKTLVVSNAANIINQIEKGGFSAAESINAAHYKEMQNGWFGTYMNYAAITASMKDMAAKGFDGMGMMNAFAELVGETSELDYGVSHMGATEGKGAVYLKTKDKNSLKVIIELLNKLYMNRDKIQNEVDENT